jgi:hypothetical protein
VPLRRAAAAAAAARASPRASSPDATRGPPPAPSIAGVWIVHSRHDVDGVMGLWGLPAIARATAKRIGGLEIAVVDAPTATTSSFLAGPPPPSAPAAHLSVRYLCPVPQFSVREVVPLAPAPPARLRRRDLKPGACTGRASVRSACGRSVAVETEWAGCEMEEVYELARGGDGGEDDDDTLVLRTTLRCRRTGEEDGGREARAVQVYKRRRAAAR